MIRKVLLLAFKYEAARLSASFDRLTRDPERAQESVLLGKVRRNEDTLFGRERGFRGIRDVRSFREKVPVSRYRDLAPYLERVVRGERNILFSEKDPLLMFATSSGTTDKPKYIPVTESFLSEYRRGWLIWISHLVRRYPGVIGRKVLPLVSASCERCTTSGVPCGSISGFTMDNQRLGTRLLYAVPSSAYHIGDELAKYYVIVRLAAERRISGITTPNPSTLIAIARVGDAYKEDLIRDVRDGTISTSFAVPESIRGELTCHLGPNPRRARELEDFSIRRGSLLPKDYWPEIVALMCWKGGSVHHFVDMLPEYYAPAPVYELGLLASEGRVSIPVSGEGSAGVLDISSHFFEFIPEDQEDSEEPDAYLAHELEEGKRYFVVMTTSSGLYRYNLHDLVEVTGFHHATPVITFLNKGKHISSITGEKITEHQIVAAMHSCATRFRVGPCTFTLVPTWDAVPYYRLLIEDKDIGAGAPCTELVKALDSELMRINIEYGTKRRSGRLGCLRLAVIRSGSFERLRERKVSFGPSRPEQYKHCYLVPDVEYGDQFAVLREVCLE